LQIADCRLQIEDKHATTPTGGTIANLQSAICNLQFRLLEGGSRGAAFAVTSRYAGFGLFGPEHMAVLRELTSTNLRPAALSGSCMQLGLAGVHCILIRPPDLSACVLIYVAWETAEYVWGRIVGCAAAKGLIPIGMETVKTLWSW
jgi:glycine cleavage system aminomethyltransferase T